MPKIEIIEAETIRHSPEIRTHLSVLGSTWRRIGSVLRQIFREIITYFKTSVSKSRIAI